MKTIKHSYQRLFSKKFLALLLSLMNKCLEITKRLTLLVTSKSFRNPSHLSTYIQLGYLNFLKEMLDDWLGFPVVGIKKKTQKLEFTNRMNPLSTWSSSYICAILSNFSILVQHLSVNISSIFRLIYLPCPHSAYIFIVLFYFIFLKFFGSSRPKLCPVDALVSASRMRELLVYDTSFRWPHFFSSFFLLFQLIQSIIFATVEA